MRKIFFLPVLLLLASGAVFAEANLTEDEYYHYCYRLCCLNQDAVYVEGPPQDCIGAGPDFEGNLERCHAQCIYEMNFSGGTIGGEFVEYVDRGVVYEPNETLENATEEEPEEIVEPAIGEEPSEVEEPMEYIDYSGPMEEVEEPGEEQPQEGGLCAAGFALAFALLAAKF